jgi:predicted nicotinamide N-methyase
MPPLDISHFIRSNLALQLAPLLPELKLYLAHPGSGSSRLELNETQYWAYLWPGIDATVPLARVVDEILSRVRLLETGNPN